MSWLSPQFCVESMGAELSGRVWLHKIYGGFGGGGVGHLYAHGSCCNSGVSVRAC